ncbi:MAG: hypothetical protein LBM61_02690 [Prevotellaceae bacterium]|jgi:hypothetical protein|nr:hypothetical protein [Prevotellaceae bacterium]
MSKLSYKVSYYVLYLLFAAILIVLGVFFFGGDMAEPLVPEQWNPKNVDAIIFLIYGLVGITILATIIGFIVQFASALKENPVAALTSLIPVVLLAALLIITWTMGSDEPLQIAGYEGTDNTDPFWLKMTDMLCYSLYALVAINLIGMIVSGIKKKLS